MTAEDIFSREILQHKFGDPFEVPPDSRSSNSYKHLREMCGRLITDAHRKLDRLPPIFFDFVHHPNINAFAFKSEKQYFIGITTGTLFILNLLVMRMLSDRRLFEHVGTPRREAKDPLPFLKFRPNADVLWDTGHIPKKPRTLKRSVYATHILEQALLFLVGHELAHITLGHVDYLNSKKQGPLIAELGWTTPKMADVIERQCLEMAADIRSISSRLASLKLTYEANRSAPAFWSSVPLTPGQLIFDWSFSMNLLFRVFGDVRFDRSILVTESYPPLPLRRTIATATAYTLVRMGWDPALKDAALLALRTAMKYVEHAFTAITGEPISIAGLRDAGGALGRGHFGRLIKELPHINQRLAAFEYEPNDS